MGAFTTIASIIDVMLRNWIVSLAILIVFIVLFIWLFKGIKSGIVATLWVVILGMIALVAGFALDYASRGVPELISYLVRWVPTVLFLFILFAATYLGVCRGLRKSLILAAQAICAAAVCIIAYFICISSPGVDKGLLNLINKFMGGEGALQSSLGVSEGCDTLRKTLAEAVPSMFSYGTELRILLQDNGAYIMTLVDVAYHVAFAIFFYICFLLLDFLLYIIYHIFYSERKFERKRVRRFAEGTTPTPYKRHRVGGGVVGFLRGLVVGVISLSFLGSAFFIVAGGTGEGKLKEYDFGNSNANYAYNIYRSVESYGAHGIYKVLNAFRDPNDTPYYLFAADLIFSGDLEDERGDVEENVKFRKELGAYTGFARDTVDLLMKYGGDDLNAIVSGSDSSGAMDRIVSVMSDPGFRLEFENLIDKFDSENYFINFALSMANTVIANLDEISLTANLSADNKDLMRVLFQSGYLSEVIPEERVLRGQVGEVTHDSLLAPPCFNLNHLFEKRDAQIILRLVLSFFSKDFTSSGFMGIIKNVVPQVEQLSIMKTERKGEINPVLGRLYCYLENKYLTEEGGTGITYAAVVASNIAWTDELHELTEISDEVFELYDNIKRDDNDILQMLLSIFDTEGKHYARNLILFDDVCEAVSDSALLGKVLASGKVLGLLRNQLQGLGDVFVPRDLVFENTYERDGTLLSYGETYYFLNGLRLLGDNKNSDLLDVLLNTASTSEIMDTMDLLADAIVRKDDRGNTLGDYLSESTLLRSVVSTVLIEEGKGTFAVPSKSLLLDSNTNKRVNLIDKKELKEVFDCLPRLIELIKPFANEAMTADQVDALINDPTLNFLLDSRNGVVEGTIANVLIEKLGESDVIVIPRAQEDFEGWVSTFMTDGELKKFLAGIRALNLKVGEFVDKEVDNGDVLDNLRAMPQSGIGTVLESSVLHYTISDLLYAENLIATGFSIIVPEGSREVLRDDVLETLIFKNELNNIISDIKLLDFSSGMSTSEILIRLLNNKQVVRESNVIAASVIHYFTQTQSVKNVVNIPRSFEAAGTAEKLATYGPTSIWYNELPALLNGLDEVFGITEGEEELIFESDEFKNRLSDFLKSLNRASVLNASQTKLDLLYTSRVMAYNLSVRLDNALRGVVSSSVLTQAKDNNQIYLYQEVKALSDATDIFGMDLLKLTNTEITAKVKGEIVHLNEPRFDYGGRTTLAIIYPSAVIRNIVTDELDKVLTGDLINENVRNGVKSSDGVQYTVYPQAEIAALVDGINVLGLKSIDEITETRFNDVSLLRENLSTLYRSGVIGGVISRQIDKATVNLLDTNVRSVLVGATGIYKEEEVSSLFTALDEMEYSAIKHIDFEESEVNTLNSESRTKHGATRLDVLYESNIVGGIITRTIRTNAGSSSQLVHSNRAYRDDLAVYRKSEISSIVSLLGVRSVSNCDLGNVSQYRAFIEPDENGVPQSYLIVMSASTLLIDNGGLVIPMSAVVPEVASEHRYMIKPLELTRLLDAHLALNGSGRADDWNVEENLEYPNTAEKRQAIVASPIMRATFTASIITQNNRDNDFSVSQRSVKFEDDMNANLRAIINEEQMLAFFDVLGVLDYDDSQPGKLSLPVFSDPMQLKLYADNIDTLYSFDYMRYKISKLMELYVSDTSSAVTERTYLLRGVDAVSSTPAETPVIPVEQIKNALV